MKTLLLIFFVMAGTLTAQSFTRHSILGVWEVSSLKPNGSTSFGKESDTRRGSKYTLLFNRKGMVKNRDTGTVYDYEIVDGKLKIYRTKTYHNGYKVKDKRHYDLYRIDGPYENCYRVKVEKKKIPGYYRREGYKWCKIQDLPQPVTYSSDDFNF